MKKRNKKFVTLALCISLALQMSNPISVSAYAEAEKAVVSRNICEELQVTARGFGETELENLQCVNDGNKETGCELPFDGTNTGTLRFDMKEEEGKPQTMLVEKIRLVANDDTIAKVDVKAVYNADPGKPSASALEGETDVNWTEEKGVKVAEIPLKTKIQTTELQVVLKSKTPGGKTTLQEVEVEGRVLKDNALSAAAKITSNYTINDLTGMTANTLDNTAKMVNITGDHPEIIFEYPGLPASVDGFMYSTNFPLQQGIQKMNLYSWNEETKKWDEIKKNITANWYDYPNNNMRQLRQVCEVVFDKPVVTHKLKFEITEHKKDWGQLIFEELNLYGSLLVSAQGLADMISGIQQPMVGDTALQMPKVMEEYADDYTVSLASSDREDVVALDGSIHSQAEAVDVNVTFQVVSKGGTDRGITKSFQVHVPKALEDDYVIVEPEEDTTSVLRNPAMGWVQYVEGFECKAHDKKNVHTCMQYQKGAQKGEWDLESFWVEIDELIEKGLAPSILYMRMQWSWFEPQDDVYSWNDPDSELSQLVTGARERGIQLAFRVLVDSTDIGAFQATPEWLTDGGQVHTYNTSGYKTPYSNDPIFLEKYREFILAFGEEFDTEDVAYIDTCGLGNWGEMNGIKVKGGINSKIKTPNDAVDYLQEAYAEAFDNVLLGVQLNTRGTNTENSMNKALDEMGFVIRRDSFGSPTWLTNSEIEDLAKRVAGGHPLFAENCYHHFVSREGRWSSSTPPSHGDDVYRTMEDMMKGVMDHALHSRANTLDLRVLEDARCWVEKNGTNGGLLEVGAQNLGYRLSPVRMMMPEQAKPGETVEIYHSWKNSGVGFLPNNNPRWDNKFKVAFALLDEKGKAVYQFNEESEKVNPGDWLKEGGEYGYTSVFQIPDELPEGTYSLGVAIVNKKKDFQPQIQLATTMNQENGWSVVGKISVENSVVPPVEENYNVIEGAGQKVTAEKDISFTVNGDIQKVIEVRVDGKVISRDCYNMFEENGNTVVVLKESFLKTLSEGKHTLTIVFSDGTAQTQFQILQSSTLGGSFAGDDKVDTAAGKTDTAAGKAAKTGDTQNGIFWLLFVAASGATVLLVRRKKYMR